MNNLEKHNEASHSYDKAIEIDSNNFKAYHNKGSALLYLNKFEDAIQFFNKAFEINPNSSISYHNKGNILIFLKQFDENKLK